MRVNSDNRRVASIAWSELPLGEMPDSDIARMVGCYSSTVSAMRRKMRIPMFELPRAPTDRIAAIAKMERVKRKATALASPKTPRILAPKPVAAIVYKKCGECRQTAPVTHAKDVWFGLFGHRCGHGEPCHSGHSTSAVTCKQCPPPPRKREVHA